MTVGVTSKVLNIESGKDGKWKSTGGFSLKPVGKIFANTQMLHMEYGHRHYDLVSSIVRSGVSEMVEISLIFPKADLLSLRFWYFWIDANTSAIGAVLSHGPVGKDVPIAYTSQTLVTDKSQYSTIELEFFAVLWADKHFRPYLFGRKFALITDHQSLAWLFSIKGSVAGLPTVD